MEVVASALAPDRRKQRTRKAALEAFGALLMEQGYEALTVAGVAERAGLGRSTLYEHFRTKEDLLAASLDRPLAALGTDPLEPAAVRAFLEHVRAHAGAVRLLLAQPLRSRVARVLAARTAAQLRARGTPAELAELRACGAAEAQLAMLALWLRGGAIDTDAMAAELARAAGLLAGARDGAEWP
jgi:AcrR family transcriptional regulator